MRQLFFAVIFSMVYLKAKSISSYSHYSSALTTIKDSTLINPIYELNLTDKYVVKNGMVFKVEGNGMVLVGVVLQFAWNSVKPYIMEYVTSQVKAFFIDKGLKVFSTDNENTESLKFSLIGNGSHYSISSSCEDHDRDGDDDNYLTQDFEDNDEEDMLRDIKFLCSSELEYCNTFYEN